MSEVSEELIIFLIRFDIFKYLVILFGLCNSPTSWQYLINKIMFDILHQFVQAYQDDIFIYSKTLRDHRLYVRQVLE